MFSDEVLAVSTAPYSSTPCPLLILRAQVDTTQATLLVTEPYFNLPNIQDTYDQLVFEEYEFAAYYRCTRASPPTRRFLFP